MSKKSKKQNKKKDKTVTVVNGTQETVLVPDSLPNIPELVKVKMEPVSDHELSSTVSGSVPDEAKTTKTNKRERRKLKRQGSQG